MIKARKGFIPALFALLTVFVLVPSMVFAANAASWDDMWAGVTDTDGLHFVTEREFDSAGIVTATPQDDTSIIGDPKYAPTTPAYFYDLAGSGFVTGGVAIDGKTFTQAAFESASFDVQLVEQPYTKPYVDGTKTKPEEAATATYPVSLTYDSTAQIYKGTVSLTNWDLEIESTKYESGIEADQNVTFKFVKATPVDPVDVLDSNYPDLVGTVGQATVTVKGVAKTPATADFYIDSTDSLFHTDAATLDYALVFPFDGAAHTVVADTVPDWTVSYQVYNAATGKWDAVDAISITDANNTDPMQAKAIFKKSGETDVTIDLEVVSYPMRFPTISFMEGDIDGQAVYLIEEGTYDPWDYVEMIPYAMDVKAVPETMKPFARYFNDASKKAVEANKAALFEAFKEYVDITATAGKNTPNEITLTFEGKDLTTAERTALDKKYEALFNNFGITDIFYETTYNADFTTAYANINWSADWEVEFTDTPTAVTYKAKKLKKKAASFTVTAFANNGAAVKYKLKNAPQKITIDKTTGEITLAKGLKKGKYKVTVKAYVPGFSDEAFETQDILIKVKK